MEFKKLIYEKKDNVAVITLNRPDVLNAIDGDLGHEIVEVCRQVENDDEVRVVVIAGAGDRAFSVGADVRGLQKRVESETKEESKPSFVRSRKSWLAANSYWALGAISKVTIAVLKGYTLGGGLELALATDIRLASEDAKLGFPEVKLGIIPGAGGTQRLARLIGTSRAIELITTSENIDAEKAYRIGLVNEVMPRDQLMERAMVLAKTIASRAPVAIRFAKEAIYKGMDMSLTQGLSFETDLSIILQTTDDRKEGVRALAEKRLPQFRNR